MRGGDYDKADDAKRAQQYLEELLVLRFQCGDSIDVIARRYQIERWAVESTIRDAAWPKVKA